MRVTRASHVEQWLLEVSKADAVDRDRPIYYTSLQICGWQTGDVMASFCLSVAELVCKEAIPPQRGGERVGRAGCGKTIVAVRISLT
jgi:hypothetical protein